MRPRPPDPARRAVTRLAPAKVNLALHVTGRRADGYHEIDTLVGFAGIADRLSAAPADTIEMIATGPFAGLIDGPPQANLVARAARLLAGAARSAGSTPGGARLTLEKNLPVAAGLGGGSADAAAALAALIELWRLPPHLGLGAIAAALGADVAMCLQSLPLRARGIGERIERLAGARRLDAILVNPRVALPTSAVFAALTHRSSPPIPALPADPFDPDFLADLRNDLEAPAARLAPVIADVLALLSRQPGCRLARMSGSGATCFALFDDAAAAARAHRSVIDIAPQWWSVPTEIGGSPPPAGAGPAAR